MAAMRFVDSFDSFQVLKHPFAIQIARRTLHDDTEELAEERNGATDYKACESEGTHCIQEVQIWIHPKEAACKDNHAILRSITDKVNPCHFASHPTMAVVVAVRLHGSPKPERKAAIYDDGTTSSDAYNLPCTFHHFMWIGYSPECFKNEVANDDILANQSYQHANNFKPVEAIGIALSISMTVRYVDGHEEGCIHCDVSKKVETITHESQ
jgi:hypothetical protein